MCIRNVQDIPRGVTYFDFDGVTRIEMSQTSLGIVFIWYTLTIYHGEVPLITRNIFENKRFFMNTQRGFVKAITLPVIPPKAVQKGFCRFTTQLLLKTEPINPSIFSPGNILL